MTPTEYIQGQLAKLKTSETSSPLAGEELVTAIHKQMFSKKFRKFASTPEFVAQKLEAVRESVKAGEPIKFVFPFGAYKLWRFEEAPEVDWAELFTIMYYSRWLTPIAAIYPPGVWFDFSSDSVIVERMNNIPKADTEAYERTLKDVFAFVMAHSLPNIRITITQVMSRYTPDEFEKDYEDKVAEVLAENNGVPPPIDDKQRATIELNVRLLPGQDTDPAWREKNNLIHEAFMRVGKRRPYTKDPSKTLVFATSIANKNSLALGTTKTSVAKFWAGVGALKKQGDSYIETVLSPEQAKVAKVTWEPTDFPDLQGKNFKKIAIID